MRENIVSFSGVRKVFHQDGRDIEALKGATFSVQSGDIVGILGESGSGKSTIVKLLMGIHEPTEGNIYFHGEDITYLRGKARRHVYGKIQMVFQDAIGSFNPRRRMIDSLRENVRQLGNGTGSQEELSALFIQVGLDPSLLHAYPHELSGGQCQRAAIARAMSVHPDVLVCDEATSALDVSAQARIMDLLVSLHQQYGMTILFITHDVALASAFASQLIIMYHGDIVEVGPTESVLTNPQSAHTKELLEAVLRIDSAKQLDQVCAKR